MLKRSISLFLLFAFLNYLVACAPRRTINKGKGEVKDPTEKITAVVFPNSEVLTYDRYGAYYLQQHNMIVGATTDGKSIAIPLESVKTFRTTYPQIISKDEAAKEKVTELVLENGEIKIFDENGAGYDASRKRISGNLQSGKSFRIKISDQVKELRTSRPETIAGEELLANAEQTIAEVIAFDKYVFTFDQDGAKFVKNWKGIYGKTRDGKLIGANVDDILYARVTKVNVVGTILTSLGVLVIGFMVFFLIALATKESCPFVYSFNGEQYVFDAEPLGGAISRGLARTDYSRLDHLKPVDGKYNLLLRNEVEETQYLDEMKLVVVDHAETAQIIPDLEGNFRTIEQPVSPSATYDEKGMDLMNFVKSQDDIVWQTHLPRDDSYKGKNLKHRLTFEFPKPAGAQSAQLIANLGTALWGSNMIREMIQLRGDKLHEWYENVNHGGVALLELFHFINREELYFLKVQVQKGDKWVEKGILPGGGPLITENRILEFDIKDIPGDKLTIRLNPPMGFWTMDYIAVEYGNHPAPDAVTEIPLATAFDHNDNNIFENLREVDKSYYIMPQVGDWAKINFDAPEERPGSKRSVFLKTTGYYEIQIDETQPEKTELIRQLLTTPGKIIEYSLDEYIKWRSQQMSSN
jgi:hypothetical protein